MSGDRRRLMCAACAAPVARTQSATAHTWRGRTTRQLPATHCDRCGCRISRRTRARYLDDGTLHHDRLWKHPLHRKVMAYPELAVARLAEIIGGLVIAIGAAAAVGVVWNEAHRPWPGGSLDPVILGFIAVWTALGVAVVIRARLVPRSPLAAVPARVLVVAGLPDGDVLVTLERAHRRRWRRVRASRELGDRLVVYGRGVAFVARGRLIDFVRLDA
jgi:hypothetical protein